MTFEKRELKLYLLVQILLYLPEEDQKEIKDLILQKLSDTMSK